MKPFPTFRSVNLSLWQSAVSEVFGRFSDEVDLTTEYCNLAAEFEDEQPPVSWLIELSENLRMTAILHQLTMAQVRQDMPRMNAIAALSVESKRFREKHWKTAHHWANCAVVYAGFHGASTRQVFYHSCMATGKFDGGYSVIDDKSVLPENCRVGIVGDWGTGASEAINVMKALKGKGADLIIHLGDIYYSGTPWECDARFKSVLRSITDKPVFTLPGNHEYYAGGTGYYWLINVLNTGIAKQSASYFCLRNKHWQLLGMDTGYNDGDPKLHKLLNTAGIPSATHLRADELLWHHHQLQSAGARNTILFSHHQPFSPFEEIGIPTGRDSSNSNLLHAFLYSPVSQGIKAWFWGHEHDFYETEPGHKGLARGFCVGHGAIPATEHARYRTTKFDGLASSPNHTPLGKHPDGWRRTEYYNRGFSILTLNGNEATIEHFQVDVGGQCHSLSLSSHTPDKLWPCP